ncbi:MAG: TAXI family TRAP transporter solute-binding subunit [Sphaerochaetaceae bacterium]|jgi:TRAP transporter TAXI family solute receptor|nr:TAXI family TRAP transporter solute-binding subunit [Sphaerochaetaceae bacterium]
MKKALIILIICSLAVPSIFANGTPEKDAAPAKKYLTMAAVASSSGLFPYVVSIGKVINEYCPAYSITVSESGGNVDNTKRMRNGEVKIANSISNTDFESYNGTGTTFNGNPYKDVRILWYYESTPIQIIVGKDTGIKSIWDLDGKPFNPGGTGTAASVVIHAAFDALGIKPKYFEAGQADAADAYSNRQIVGTVKTGSFPDSFVTQCNANRPCDMLSISQEDMAKILEAIPSVATGTVPAGAYEGIDHDSYCLSTFQGIQCSMDFSQQDGYDFFKAMWEDGKSIWQNGYPNGAKNDVPAMTLSTAKIPLQAGTVQYLVEHGYQVPADIIPPEYVAK